jgi:hypothetical protein
MPGVEAFALGDRGEQPCTLLALNRNRADGGVAVPGEHLVEAPLAEAAVGVVENDALT